MNDAALKQAGNEPCRWVPTAWAAAFAVLCLLALAVGLSALRYGLNTPDIAPPEMARRFVEPIPWLVTHAVASGIALALGPFQFLTRLRQRWPVAHRWSGRVYILACLLGGVTAIPLAATLTAGHVAASGFLLLALAWIGLTLAAWRAAVRGAFAAHRTLMIYGFALTCSAISLRLQLVALPPLLAAFGRPDPTLDDLYQILGWSCWMPNLAVVWWASRSAVRHGQPA